MKYQITLPAAVVTPCFAGGCIGNKAGVRRWSSTIFFAFLLSTFIFGAAMPTITLSEKKLKKIARINEVVKDYFSTHPSMDNVAATHLMPLFIRKGVFLKDTENGLPVRVILRELYKTDQLHLLKDAIVMIEKRSYYFYKK